MNIARLISFWQADVGEQPVIGADAGDEVCFHRIKIRKNSSGPELPELTGEDRVDHGYGLVTRVKQDTFEGAVQRFDGIDNSLFPGGAVMARMETIHFEHVEFFRGEETFFLAAKQFIVYEAEVQEKASFLQVHDRIDDGIILVLEHTVSF